MVRLGLVDPLASLTLVFQDHRFGQLISKNMDVSRVKPCQCIGLRDLQFTGYSMSFLLTVKNVTGFTGHIFPSTSHL
jgi:hypothetical protein